MNPLRIVGWTIATAITLAVIILAIVIFIPIAIVIGLFVLLLLIASLIIGKRKRHYGPKRVKAREVK